MSTSSTSSGTKQDDVPLHHLGKYMLPTVYRSGTTKSDFTKTDIARWTLIFSCLHFNEYERLVLRTLCHFFRAVLAGPTGMYTIFPHPKHPSLDSLTTRLNEMARDGKNVPLSLFIANGVHEGPDGYIVINIPISIIGESRERCIVMGGLEMNGEEEDDVNVSNLTLRDSKGYGVCGDDGASIHLDNVSVENSGWSGVSTVFGTKRNTMQNCNVSHSKESGLVVVGDGLMTIDGKDTTIHHNCTNGSCGSYGLNTWDSSSSIHFASSLTIETISKNNGGGGNYGGKGTIAVVDNEGTIIETIQEA